MKEVYLLTRDSTTRGERELTHRVFSSLLAAQKEMNAQYKAEKEDWFTTFGKENVIANGAGIVSSISEIDEYAQNHCTWKIEKLNIE